jgi:NAD(P)-dependent dehydrogenase (short-subunit alcohol dehydrogenase family)
VPPQASAKAAAVKLADHGATVVIHGHSPIRGVGVVEQIEQSGGHAGFVGTDLSDPADVARLAADAGTIDILVNNAGSSCSDPATSWIARPMTGSSTATSAVPARSPSL